MKTVVLVKQILDPQGITVRRDKERIFINRQDYIIDPGSKAAIEAALRLKGQGDELLALSVGEPQADDALREALAMGCDEAYLLSDEKFKDTDVAVTTRILAAAVEKLGGVDLIVAGRESGDTGAGQIGPRLAEALGYGQVTDAYSLDIGSGKNKVQATRRWGQGYAIVAFDLPAVVTVAPEAFSPRYAPGARIIKAYREWDVPVWGAAELDLEGPMLAPVITFRGESFPPPLEVGEKLRGDPVTVAQDAVMALKLQKVI